MYRSKLAIHIVILTVIYCGKKSLFLKYFYARFSYFMNASFKLISLYSNISIVRCKYINTYIDIYPFLNKYYICTFANITIVILLCLYYFV